MRKFKIGVIVDSLGLPTLEAVKKASELGVDGLQLRCTSGENSPENLSGAKAHRLLDYVQSYGLEFSAICGDLGKGFGNKEQNPKLIEKSMKIMELAKELGTDIVTTHIGVIPDNPDHDRYKIMQEACFKLAEFADKINSRFAVETGPETSIVLKNFLESLNSKGVSVNMDPANLVMVTRDNPIDAVYNLKDYIVHTHAKDGRNLKLCNPEYIYGILQPIPEEIRNTRFFREMPLGTGDVPFARYLQALETIGYNGYLTIEQKPGENPVEEIKASIDYLNKIMAEN